MIKNEYQYEQTKKWCNYFVKTIKLLKESKDSFHPVQYETYINSFQAQVDDLLDELYDYEFDKGLIND